MNRSKLIDFIIESNEIEKITYPPKGVDINAAEAFLALPAITIPDLENFVQQFQPDARLRDKSGMDVRVRNHVPVRGGVYVRRQLQYILMLLDTKHVGKYFSPHYIHALYETLHPFTDCNGRSGRILWLWQMRKENRLLASMGFLQTWYYQSLEEHK